MSMLKRLRLLLLVLAAPVLAQTDPGLVSVAQLDAAGERVSATLATDDPRRSALLKLYADTRAALADIDNQQQLLQEYSQARANAQQTANAIEAALAERDVAAARSAQSVADMPLPELEQFIQVSKAELDAAKSRQSDLRDAISGMSGRAAEIRERLTALGTAIPELESQLALMPGSAELDAEQEARLWLARVRTARAKAEKAALDAELLSQPMRLELLKAQQDQATYDIGILTRRLQALERRAADLRLGQASDARAEAERTAAGTVGKHALVQALADENTELTASFAQISASIEEARGRDDAVIEQAERLEADLQSIERRLDILGMSAAVGSILREQQIQLPQRSQSRREVAKVVARASEASIRQIELEDERRKLVDAGEYVDRLLVGVDPSVAEGIRGDLLALAADRRKLVEQALAMETTLATALGSLELGLRRYAKAVDSYRDFISERLFWMPSRSPFSLFQGAAFTEQITDVFHPGGWLGTVRALPAELLRQPLTLAATLLVLLMVYVGPRLKAALAATGREVGYVRTDLYSNTLLALFLSFLLSITWPLLMLIFARLFEMEEGDSAALAGALSSALSRSALYFWGLEFLRVLLLPKGLVEAHFRWPPKRTATLYHRVVRLEQTFIPAGLLVTFSLQLYPREVGGALGALAVIVVLLSIAHFFRHLPHFMQGKMTMVLSDRPSVQGTTLGRMARALLVWVPVLATVAVLFGYIYTAIELCLLLIQTIVLFCLILLFHELGLRWLRMTRRRMVVRARAEAAAQATADAGDALAEDDYLENDPELLSDEGTKLLNLLTLLGGLGGIVLIWAEVFPALGILDSIELWHQSVVQDDREVTVPVTLGDLFGAVFIAVVGWIAIRRVPGLLEILLRQRMSVPPATAYAATRVLQYSATAALVFLVVGSLGGAWSQIQWAVAALSVGIGFGLQEIVANFISGLIILFEQPVRVGDTITVGGVSGKVTRIRIRATTIRDFDRRELLVPNKEFITQQLLNWSLSDQVTRWILEVGVAYGSDLDRAMAIVREAAERHPLVLDEPEPLVTFEQFGDNSLLIRMRFFMDQLEKRLVVASDLMLDINRHLNEAGIVVAFPQRDVHLDTSRPLEVRMIPTEEEMGRDERARPLPPSG